ncbi:MAG: 2-dehydro-3-deoxygalactonokinase [Verrucomicrobiales bacterium]|jgi:2-dehydro-3-deoxygalactonokinase
MDQTTEKMITADWGSTNLRASLIAEDGAVIDRREAPLGIRSVGERSFESIMEEVCGDWLGRGLPVLLSGMIGSREGWVEVPYVDTPAGTTEIAAALHRFDSEIAIVPGLRHLNENGTADVMRGEETQVLGALAQTGPDALICIPGTHSKWILCRDGQVSAFRTWVTGEAFELLSKSPLLAKGNAADPDGDAFLRGLDHSNLDGGMLHQIFLGRTDMLMGKIDAADLPSLLSGILIGGEIREAINWAETDGGVALFGAGETVLRFYERAFAHFGLKSQRLDGDLQAAGAFRLQNSE